MKTSTTGLAIGSAVLLAACGGGGGTTTDAQIVDAGVDAGGDGCETTSIGAQQFVRAAAGFSNWTGLTVPDLNLNPGETAAFHLDFIYGIRPTLVGTWDLADEIDGNYATCASCIRAVVRDQGGNFVRNYFQSAGSLTLTVDPSTRVLSGSISGLEMVEVVIANDFTSTPVPDGPCLTVGDSTLDASGIPTSWSCPDTEYSDGSTCDCGCGAPDPDCADLSAPVNGCAEGQICVADSCGSSATNDTCATAAPLTLGVPYDGHTTGATNDYEDGLEICTTYTQEGPDVVHSITLAQGQTVTIELANVSADFDPSLAILGPGASACDVDPVDCPVGNGADDNLAGRAESFQFTAPTAGDYYIIVDTFFPDETGSYTLLVSP